MFCNSCNRPLRNDQKFCPECGTAASLQSSQSSIAKTRSGTADPKVIAAIIAFVLILIAFSTLHIHSALIACLLISIAAFAIFVRSIRFKTRLAAIGVAFAFVLLLNGIEGWQERQGQQRQDELAKQKTAAEIAQTQKQEEAFRELSPKGHLDNARTMLKDVLSRFDASTHATIANGIRDLDAIPTSAPEFRDAKLLRQQYEAARKKYDVQQAKLRAVEVENNARARTHEAIATMDSDPPKLEAQTVCRTMVEQNLKSPSTADFVDFSYLKYQGTGRFHIQLRMDAQNSFGAKLRNTFDCQVQCADSQTCVVMKVKEL